MDQGAAPGLAARQLDALGVDTSQTSPTLETEAAALRRRGETVRQGLRPTDEPGVGFFLPPSDGA